LFSQAKAHSEKKPKFRVVGYYSFKAAMTADLKTVPFEKLMHINLLLKFLSQSIPFSTDFSTRKDYRN